MKINHIKFTSKILAGLSLVKQKPKTKNTFEKATYSELVIKNY